MQQRSVELRSEPERSEVSDESGGFPAEEAEPEESGEPPAAVANAAGRSESEDEKQKNGRPRLRAPCAYGSSCYR